MDTNKMKEGLKLIKEGFAMFLSTEQKFASAKLADGTTIEIQGETVVGTPVMVVTDQGAAPIPDGEYTMEDGTVVMTSGGVIAEVKAPNAEEAAAPSGEQPMGAEGNAAPAAPTPTQIIERIEKEMVFAKEEIEKLKGEIVTITESFNAVKAELNTEKEKFSKAAESFNAALETFGDEPQNTEKTEKNVIEAPKKETIEEFRARVFKSK